MTAPSVVQTDSREGFGWRRLGLAVAVVLAGAHLTTAAVIRDLDAFAVAVLFAVGIVLTRVKGGLAGWIVLALASFNVLVWTTPAAVSSATQGARFVAVALPATMAVIAASGLAAAAGVLVTRRQPGRGEAGAMLLVAVSTVVLLALLAGAALTSGSGTAAQEGDVELVTDRTAFSVAEIAVAEGAVAVHLTNSDYFWHTFTVPDLGVDLWVPVGAAARVEFDAPEGTYEFVCRIPGHVAAGMVGTLVVGSAP